MSSSFADREIDETDEPGEDRYGTCLSEADNPLPEEEHEEELRAVSDQLDKALVCNITTVTSENDMKVKVNLKQSHCSTMC